MTLGEEAVAEEAGRGGWEVEGLRRPKRNKMHPARVNVHVAPSRGVLVGSETLPFHGAHLEDFFVEDLTWLHAIRQDDAVSLPAKEVDANAVDDPDSRNHGNTFCLGWMYKGKPPWHLLMYKGMLS